MKRRKFIQSIPAIAVVAGSVPGSGLNTQELKAIVLPKPEKDGGRSVLASLQERKTSRSISSKELPVQLVSNLLWAAFGVNREATMFGKKGRTAPSASNSQEIDLYIAFREGVYTYDAIHHSLLPVASGDFRKRSGWATVAVAPMQIFFIVNTGRYDTGPSQPDPNIGDPEVQKSYYYTAVGFIAQNVYLYAASIGLAAWFHNCERKTTIKEFYLSQNQKVLFAQSIGYPG
jgi:hypothetical protein